MASNERRILELFSGIGGMHSALLCKLYSCFHKPLTICEVMVTFSVSKIPGSIIAAADINTVANAVYKHNHPDVKLLTTNIQAMTPAFIDKLNVDTILMSPPCQPFTRVGKQMDVADNRSDAFVHLCKIIKELKNVNAILMENVKGFETSMARDLYIKALQEAKYEYQEFLLSPSQIGVPNTRYRYYCLARKCVKFTFKQNEILLDFPSEKVFPKIPTIMEFLKFDDETNYTLLSDNLLEKRAKVLDIVCAESRNTSCFTKAYTHYTEGTGSVYCPSYTKDYVNSVFGNNKILDTGEGANKLELLKTLQLRYFTPYEVSQLMCFPIELFSFPAETTTKQKYRLLGNSINCLLVSELIKLLFNE